MSRAPDLAVWILAGGISRRFGSHKAFAELDGKTLLAHVVDRIRPQTRGPVLINASDAKDYRPMGLPIIQDQTWAGVGPLAGIHTALEWALDAGREKVVTVAVDQPFLPDTYIATLAQGDAPSIARCRGRLHPINALWSVTQLHALGAYLGDGGRDAHGWARRCNAGVAEFPTRADEIDPFLNVNTKVDLEIASQFQGMV